MSQSERAPFAVIVFALGGALVVFVFYSILDSVGKPWIDGTLFFGFFVLPLSLLAFFLLGLGLLLIVRSQQRVVT